MMAGAIVNDNVLGHSLERVKTRNSLDFTDRYREKRGGRWLYRRTVTVRLTEREDAKLDGLISALPGRVFVRRQRKKSRKEEGPPPAAKEKENLLGKRGTVNSPVQPAESKGQQVGNQDNRETAQLLPRDESEAKGRGQEVAVVKIWGTSSVLVNLINVTTSRAVDREGKCDKGGIIEERSARSDEGEEATARGRVGRSSSSDSSSSGDSGSPSSWSSYSLVLTVQSTQHLSRGSHFMLVDVELLKRTSLSYVEAADSGDLVLDNGLLWTGSDASLIIRNSGSGDLFLSTKRKLSALSVDITSSGSGDIQLEAPSGLQVGSEAVIRSLQGGRVKLVTAISSPNISVLTAGPGSVFIAFIADCALLRTEGGGEGDVSYYGEGSCERHEVEHRGSGSIFAAAVVAKEVEVKVTGKGRVEVQAINSLLGSANGGGAVRFIGRPRIISSGRSIVAISSGTRKLPGLKTIPARMLEPVGGEEEWRGGSKGDGMLAWFRRFLPSGDGALHPASGA